MDGILPNIALMETNVFSPIFRKTETQGTQSIYVFLISICSYIDFTALLCTAQ